MMRRAVVERKRASSPMSMSYNQPDGGNLQPLGGEWSCWPKNCELLERKE